VPDSEIADPRSLDGAGWNDGQACTRMMVEVLRTRTGAFSGLVGQKTLTSKARSVIRGGINTQNGAVPALLTLDRTGCQAITNSSNGSGNLGIIVRRVSDVQGGTMHSDSNAAGCGTNNTAYVIYGASNSNGGTSITVENAEHGIQGSISTYATSIGSSRGAAVFPSGISHQVTAGPVVGRLPFDRQFNPSSRPAISNLHSTGYEAATLGPIAALAQGYTVVGCLADGTISGARVYVNCADYAVPGSSATFPNATTVVFAGKVTVPSSKTLNMPSVQNVYVRGCTSSCSGSGYYSIKVDGGLYINIGNNALSSAACSQRLGPGAGGSTTNTSRLATFNGPLVISGQARLCQTTVYLGANTPTYVREASTSGLPNCSGALPCPLTSGAAAGAYYNVSGNHVDWTAPNQLNSIANDAHPFEDLALWSESSDTSDVKSGGVMLTGGIFFTPNSTVEFRSPAVGSPRNAQFVSRRLQLLQGTLDMRPVGSDAVRVPLPGGYGLIR
jgi:hypothetical protein